MQISYGSKITMNFSVTLADGTVADSSYGNDPVTFVLGDGSLEKTLELSLIGLQQGESQTLTLDPGQAFGTPDAEAIVSMPRRQFPEDLDVTQGTIIEFTRQDGEEVAGTILHADNEKVSVDFNHPLAGQKIVFQVEILEVDQCAGTE